MLPPSIIERINSMLAYKGQGWVQLHTFHVVGQCGSYYGAHGILGLSGCSSVRRRLETLQADLDLNLVYSDGSGIVITPTGQQLLKLLGSAFGGGN